MVFTAFCFVYNILALLRFLCIYLIFGKHTGLDTDILIYGWHWVIYSDFNCDMNENLPACTAVRFFDVKISFICASRFHSVVSVPDSHRSKLYGCSLLVFKLRPHVSCISVFAWIVRFRWVTRWLDYSSFYSSKHTFHCGYGHFHEICNDFCYGEQVKSVEAPKTESNPNNP